MIICLYVHNNFMHYTRIFPVYTYLTPHTAQPTTNPKKVGPVQATTNPLSIAKLR